MEPTVFISYATSDREIVARLRADLSAGGADVFEFIESAAPGQPAWDQVATQIRNSNWFLVVLSPASLESRPVNEEIRIAHHSRVNTDRPTMIPLILGDCARPPLIQHLSEIDLRNYESGIDQLWRELKLESDAQNREVLTRCGIGHLVDGAYTAVRRFLSQKGPLPGSVEGLGNYSSLASHVQTSSTWTNVIQFRDLQEEKNLDTLYVEPNVLLTPQSLQYEKEEPETEALKSLLHRMDRHVLLLGSPGAGKTTALKHVFNGTLQDNKDTPNDARLPLIFELGQLEADDDLVHSILRATGISVRFHTDIERQDRDAFAVDLLIQFLSASRAILLLDGYDEIYDQSQRDIVAAQIRHLCRRLVDARVLVTSRPGVFQLSVGKLLPVELSTLNPKQIDTFARHWFTTESRADAFLRAMKESPYSDTAIRPLSLAHLCAIFDRIGRVPEKPKTVYRKLVGLLLEEWDQQKGIRRKSRYAHFESDRKLEFLARFAFELTTRAHSISFDRIVLHGIYEDVHADFGLPLAEDVAVISEIETHSGLITQIETDRFRFSHLSLREYLTAEHLVHLPAIPMKEGTLFAIPNELAIAISLSSHPTGYLGSLFLEKLRDHFEYVGLSKSILAERSGMYDCTRPVKRTSSRATPKLNSFLESLFNRMLIERPDFPPTRLTGLVFAYLYTLVRVGLDTSVMLNAETLASLNRVIDTCGVRGGMIALRDCLNPDYLDVARAADQGYEYVFETNKIVEDCELKLPHRLFIRADLLMPEN